MVESPTKVQGLNLFCVTPIVITVYYVLSSGELGFCRVL